MGDVCYEPLIRDMTWSYSRIKSFGDCKYKWFLKYIHRSQNENLFFSDFGKLVHSLLAEFYKGEKTAQQLKVEYLLRFRNEVSKAPSVKMMNNFFQDGLSCFDRLPEKANAVVDVEKYFKSTVNGVPIVGFVDLILRTKNDGFTIVDHKSAKLKPYSKSRKYTKTDKELDEYFRQLYLYAALVKEAYGVYPDKLCLNCYRNGNMIIEPFRKEKYLDTLRWVKSSVDMIAKETDFDPNVDYFKCRYLCDVHNDCEYFNG